jgi:hypothetical protein
VLSGSGAPTIAGTRSLYMPPLTSIPPGTGDVRQLVARLAVDPGDTVLRFSYRIVVPANSTASGFGQARYQVASQGGMVISGVPSIITAPTTVATIGSYGDFMVGPLATADIDLSFDVIDEVTFMRIAPGGSGLFSFSVAGMILDDLRLE